MNQEIIPKNSYLLLDTTVISRLSSALSDSRNIKFNWAYNFYKEIEERKIQLLTCDLLIFEFLRGSKNLSAYLTKLSFLEAIFHSYIQGIDLEDIRDATLVSNIYSKKEVCKNTPSFVDLFLVTILKNAPTPNIILATFNHRDFPVLFLDRKIMSIDLGNEIENLCFYKFNKRKFDSALKDFLRTARKKKT